MNFSNFAVHFLIHYGESNNILSFISKCQHNFKSYYVNGYKACNINEFLDRKHVFLSTN
jgi:hypothetical protein